MAVLAALPRDVLSVRDRHEDDLGHLAVHQANGNALLGGLSSKALIRLALDGDRVTDEERIDMGRRIRDVIESPDGAILVLTDGKDGELLRLTPAAEGTSR